MFQVYSKVIQLSIYLHTQLCVCVYIHIYFFRFFSVIGYDKILNIFPCAIQEVPVVYLSYSKIERRVVQRFPVSLLPRDVHSLPHFQHPFPFIYSTTIQTITRRWKELRM